MRKMLDITWNCMNMFDEKKLNILQAGAVGRNQISF
jgi:hypothetical protein